MFLRVWHDNSGGEVEGKVETGTTDEEERLKKVKEEEEGGRCCRRPRNQTGNWASWQLAFISVRDLQTRKKTLFLANRWLAIDRDDGEVCTAPDI